MEGKKKEKKLIINDVPVKNRSDIIGLLERSMVLMNGPKNVFCRDSYYDDENESLFNQGGSLKIREQVTESVRKTVIMRTKTSYPQKMKFSMWDEAEVPVNLHLSKASEVFENLKSFFPNFDFSTINSEPVLICSTVRSIYQFQSNITIFIDHVDYEAYPRVVGDDLIKVRADSTRLQDSIFRHLMEHLPGSELIECSRYERAVERLNLM